MKRNRIGSALLLLAVLGGGAALATWKVGAMEADAALAESQPEPIETVTAAVARPLEHRQTTTSIGTVVALRSITLRNEMAGTVRHVALVPGQIVETGTILVTLDVSVEEAELKAQEARAALAESFLARTQIAGKTHAVSETEVDRALAERDVALAEIARTRAIIARKTIRAPFRSRVGIADVHPGQYLEEGALLTTLQGVDDSAYVDFTVAQRVATGLRAGQPVEVFIGAESGPATATIVAVDARIDPLTRNATVRARIAGTSDGPSPGASVRVRVPIGETIEALAVPVSALRKGPAGDHVFLLVRDQSGNVRAQQRRVESGPVLGDEVVIREGLAAGDEVAASGSFKLFEGVLVALAGGAGPDQRAAR